MGHWCSNPYLPVRGSRAINEARQPKLKSKLRRKATVLTISSRCGTPRASQLHMISNVWICTMPHRRPSRYRQVPSGVDESAMVLSIGSSQAHRHSILSWTTKTVVGARKLNGALCSAPTASESAEDRNCDSEACITSNRRQSNGGSERVSSRYLAVCRRRSTATTTTTSFQELIKFFLKEMRGLRCHLN